MALFFLLLCKKAIFTNKTELFTNFDHLFAQSLLIARSLGFMLFSPLLSPKVFYRTDFHNQRNALHIKFMRGYAPAVTSRLFTHLYQRCQVVWKQLCVFRIFLFSLKPSGLLTLTLAMALWWPENHACVGCTFTTVLKLTVFVTTILTFSCCVFCFVFSFVLPRLQGQRGRSAENRPRRHRWSGRRRDVCDPLRAHCARPVLCQTQR